MSTRPQLECRTETPGRVAFGAGAPPPKRTGTGTPSFSEYEYEYEMQRYDTSYEKFLLYPRRRVRGLGEGDASLTPKRVAIRLYPPSIGSAASSLC